MIPTLISIKVASLSEQLEPCYMTGNYHAYSQHATASSKLLVVPSGCYCPHKAGYSHDTVPRGGAPSLASFRTCSRCACCECAHRLTSFRTCRHRQLPTAGDGVKQQCSSPSPGQSVRALEPKLRPTTARDANEHSFHGAGEVSSLDGVLNGV